MREAPILNGGIMQGVEEKLDQVHRLIEAITAHRDQMIATAVRDTGFTRRECSIETDLVISNLQGFDDMASVFADRLPICGPDQEVALALTYNGSAWLNTAIVSIFITGIPTE